MALLQKTIKVKAIDIKKGKRSCKGACPIAKALLRAFPTATKVAVDGIDMAVYFRGGKTLRADMPRRAGTFVYRFDVEGRDAVKPISFVAKFVPDLDLLR